MADDTVIANKCPLFPSAPILSTFHNGSWVPIGEWASLSCTAPCTDAVLWYTKNNPHPLRYSLPGLKIHKTVMQLSGCSSRKDNYTEVLEVFSTAQSNATEFQCVSIPVCTNTDVQCRPQVCYSDFAQLLGKSLFVCSPYTSHNYRIESNQKPQLQTWNIKSHMHTCVHITCSINAKRGIVSTEKKNK